MKNDTSPALQAPASPPAEDVVEAVARAIYLTSTPPGARWEAVEEDHREGVWRRRARAALAAIPIQSDSEEAVREALLAATSFIRSVGYTAPKYREALTVLQQADHALATVKGDRG